MTETKIRLQMLREVAEKADSETFYSQAEKLGLEAAHKITSRHRKQMSDLEEVANTALKVADVLNHIKNQSARREYWRELGPILLEVVQTDLGKHRDQICRKLNLANDQNRARHSQQVHLQLIREFVRQLVAQYEYQCMLADRGAGR